MDEKRDMLRHVRELQLACAANGGSASIDLNTLVADVKLAGTRHRLFPQFMRWYDGRKLYESQTAKGTFLFCGWRPYWSKNTRAIADKLDLKNWYQSQQVRVPAASQDPAWDQAPVIVKRRLSSFGESIRGPFGNTAEHTLQPEKGEFFEAFVTGTIVKAWCMNGVPLSAEFMTPPVVRGDGQRSVRELLREQMQGNPDTLFAQCEEVLRFSGRNLETVLDEGDEQLIEYRYGYCFGYRVALREECLDASSHPTLWPQLAHAARVTWSLIQLQIKGRLIYTVDAVLDASERLWVLEANSNPMVQPRMYSAMIQNLVDNGADPDEGRPLPNAEEIFRSSPGQREAVTAA